MFDERIRVVESRWSLCVSSGRIFSVLYGHSLPHAFILIGGMTTVENVKFCQSLF